MVEKKSVKSMIGVPLEIENRVVGVMFIHYRDPQKKEERVWVRPPGFDNPVWRRKNGWRPGFYNAAGELLWRSERDWYKEGALLTVRLAQWEMEKMGIDWLGREIDGEEWFVE